MLAVVVEIALKSLRCYFLHSALRYWDAPFPESDRRAGHNTPSTFSHPGNKQLRPAFLSGTPFDYLLRGRRFATSSKEEADMKSSNAVNLRTPPPQSQPRRAPAIFPADTAAWASECFTGVSAHVAELKLFVSVQANLSEPVLLIGERGLRQHKIARAIHETGVDRSQPFLSVETRGLAEEAADRLLFGPQGIIRTCQAGTLYLNQLTRLSPLLQQRIAIHLEERRQSERLCPDLGLRLVIASEDGPAGDHAVSGLLEILRPSTFRLIPLRERGEDIPSLAMKLVERIARRLGKGEVNLSPGVARALAAYHWERNIDELEAVLESMIAFLPAKQIDDSLLPAHICHASLNSIPAGGIDLPQVMEDFERGLIETALRQTGGNQRRAAALLGMCVQTLNMKLKRFARCAGSDPERK